MVLPSRNIIISCCAGASRVVEGVSKSRRSEGPHCLHQDAECLKEKDTEYDKTILLRLNNS